MNCDNRSALPVDGHIVCFLAVQALFEEDVMRTLSAAAVATALAACVACSNGGNSSNGSAVDSAQRQGDQTATSDMRSTRENNSNDHQAVTLEGCVQRGGGTFTPGFVLTMVNSPSTVGTAGSVTTSGSSVEREQMRIAASTYRLDPQGDVKLDNMVGKRVRVNGTITEEAKAPNGKGAIGSDADTQRPNRDRIDRDDHSTGLELNELAKVEVTSASIVTDSCTGVVR